MLQRLATIFLSVFAQTVRDRKMCRSTFLITRYAPVNRNSMLDYSTNGEMAVINRQVKLTSDKSQEKKLEQTLQDTSELKTRCSIQPLYALN